MHCNSSRAKRRIFCILLLLVLLPCLVFGVGECSLPVTGQRTEPLKLDLLPPTNQLSKIDSRILASSRAGDRREIMVVFELTEARQEYVEALREEGIVVQSVYEDLVQGLATPQQILNSQQFEFIRFVRPPKRPIPQVVSEGVNVIQANLAAQSGLTGKGVKVAVIDQGFDVKNPEIAKNVKEFKSFRADGDIKTRDPTHGTACAEIIVDVAPDVELYLYNSETDVEFLRALDYVAGRGVNILSMSLGWYNIGPYDGTSTVSKALDSVRQRGVLPVVSAGNEARTHWMGNFTDLDNDGWHEFSPSVEGNGISTNPGDEVGVFLSWDDWPRSYQDYDLYLYDSLNRIVASSENRQRPQWPTEEFYYIAPTKGTYYVAIRKRDATRAVYFELFVMGVKEIEYRVEAGSIPNLGDARGALTVGATYWANDVLEDFSSQGPTADGRIKPDIVAPDGVSTSSFGSRGFFGTSASAPHVAGAAALIFAANPRLSADDVARILENGSNNLGRPTKNNLYGSGRVRVSFASFDVIPKVSDLIIDGTTYSANQLPLVLTWNPGTTHNLSILSPTVSGAETRASFTRWTDNNNPLSTQQAVTLTYAGGPRIIVAEFKSQFLLTVISPYGNPKGSDWYDSGTPANFSITSPYDHGNLTRRVFVTWTGNSTANSPSTILIMDSPKKVIATWKTQYYLAVTSPYGQARGEGWYDKSATASISVDQTVDHGNLTRRMFTKWAGDTASTKPSTTITIDSPKKAMAQWQTQYYLTVNPNGGKVTGEGWQDYDSSATVTAVTPSDIVAEKARLLFTGWTGDITSNSTTITLRMSQPKRVVANWKTQFFLKINPQGGVVDKQSQWVDKDLSITINAVSPSNEIEKKSRQIFTGWGGAVSSTNPKITLTMDEAKTLNANWKMQFYLQVISTHGDPKGEGWYDERATATASVTSPVGIIVQQKFARWSGDIASQSQAVTILMDSPKAVVAEWTTDYTRLLILLGIPVVLIGVLLALRIARRGKGKQESRQSLTIGAP